MAKRVRYSEDASFLRKWVLSTLDRRISEVAIESAVKSNKYNVSKNDMVFAVAKALSTIDKDIQTLIGPAMQQIEITVQSRNRP